MISPSPPPVSAEPAQPSRLRRPVAQNRRDRVAVSLAVWFGCGYAPRAPGTVGSLAALPVYALAVRAGPLAVFAAGALVTLIGIWAAAHVSRLLRTTDPQVVVIDEVAGVLLTLAVAPQGPWGVAIGCVLFRLFDQVKPWPVPRFERLPGGYGIMLDDVAAALVAGVILVFVQFMGWL